MSSKLIRYLPQYSTYTADQVLTHNQLNETISYFEDQDRLTRIGLSGVGIAYGLGIHRTSSGGLTTLIIDQGFALTTDGDLLTLYSPVEQGSKEKDINIPSLSFSHYRQFEDENARYDRFSSDGAGLWELCDENAEEAVPLQGFENLENHVMLLYLESYSKEPDICGDINCDNQGVEQVAKLRVLLISISLADRLIGDDPIFRKIREKEESIDTLRPISLLKAMVNGETVRTSSQLDQRYRRAIQDSNALRELSSGLAAILSYLRPIWERDPVIRLLSNDLSDLLARNFPANGSRYAYFQYRYKLLSDVLSTYLELIKRVKEVNAVPNPDITAFPKHILLGRPGHEGYRHTFCPSPALDGYESQVDKIKFLLRKIYYQLFSFDPLPENGLRIIPKSGEEGVPSVPFYYHNSTGLRNHWVYQQWLTPFSYHYELGNNPLIFYTEMNGYLIGGHLGKEGENTFHQLKALVSEFGLDIRIRHLDLSHQLSDYQRFVRDHPGISHNAGVPSGGTYVLLSENNTVVGDFSLPYPVQTISQTSISHIKVQECRYPWISTLKYLNNLVRSISGTPRRVGVMPRYYRLVVNEYQINGQRMINGPVVVEVPLSEILTRRMHAITEALNERFPEGLIFDFNEELKRFVIIRAYDDDFRITFTDNTLSVSSPAFTYTQDGYFSGNNVFRLDAQRCEEIKKYRPSTYRQLQGEFAPVNKDDDRGRHQGRWAEWYRLITRLEHSRNSLVRPRFITNLDQMPRSVRNIIQGVRLALQQSRVAHELYLAGEWVEGGWVSSEMLNQYGRSNNTNDPIVRFIQLRRLLHQKDQATKASLFVVLSREMDRNRLMQTLRPWSNRVDIYVEGPRMRGRRLIVDGKNKIRLT